MIEMRVLPIKSLIGISIKIFVPGVSYDGHDYDYIPSSLHQEKYKTII